MTTRSLLLLLLLTSSVAQAQSGPELRSFREHAGDGTGNDSAAGMKKPAAGGYAVNYLAPLAHAYLSKQQALVPSYKKGYYDNLSQTLSFTGDYNAVLETLKAGNSPADTGMLGFIQERIRGFKGTRLADAKSVILQAAASRQVVMINEAHCKPVHRAFTYSLLEGLYQEGFRYLAMETFTNHPSASLTRLTANTGYYTSEPVAGELVRKALELGFTLVPYEDTVFNHTSSQRDSAQAMHIFGILQKDPAAKILVHAGYGHIGKQKIGDYTPMGLQFGKISGIDPFCIDQTQMTEEGNEGISGAYYNLLLKAYPVQKTSVLMKGDKPVGYYTDADEEYDLRIIHPRSSYQARRATWYALGKDRKATLVSKCPSTAFLVQAYYAAEWQSLADSAVPADQTYLQTRKGAYTLFLRKGRYNMVFRDMDYRVVSVSTMNIL